MQPWFLQGLLLPFSGFLTSKAPQRGPVLYDDTSTSCVPVLMSSPEP